jgi:beta-glucanase (GH16 family)
VRLQALSGDRPRNVTRVPRTAALGLVLAVLGLFSVCVTSYVPTEAATLGAGMHRTATTSAATSPDGPKGHWQLVFSDHFTGTTLDTANWSTCYYFGCTNEGNNELEWYQPSQVKVGNGTVSLTVVPDATHGKRYVSGMLSSHGKFSFRYGYAQIVAKLPVGKGLWSAFWMQPEKGGWPPEIDILENWAQSHNVSLYVHYNATNQYDSANVLVPTASSAFHTYGVDWEPGTINWYVDGFLVAHLSVSITQPEYLIADLAVNGRFPPNSADRFPQSLVIRSIRVWQHPTQINAQTTH